MTLPIVINILRGMRFFVLPILLLAACSAAAAPASRIEDPADLTAIAQAETGFAGQFKHVRQTMASRTSEMVVGALGFLGVPYRLGGVSVETGFDCSGFVRAMYDQAMGLALPRRAEEQARATEKIDRSDLRPGDLVFFNTMRRAFSHVGIYIGDGKFIHAPRTGSKVRVENMNVSYWQRRFNGARRVSAPDGTELQAATALSPLK